MKSSWPVKKYYDRHTREDPLPQLKPGDVVCFQHGKVWNPAVVTGVASRPRSFVIEHEGGQRNRRHLIQSSEPQPLFSFADTSEVNANPKCSAPGPAVSPAAEPAPSPLVSPQPQPATQRSPAKVPQHMQQWPVYHLTLLWTVGAIVDGSFLCRAGTGTNYCVTLIDKITISDFLVDIILSWLCIHVAFSRVFKYCVVCWLPCVFQTVWALRHLNSV